MLIIALRFDDYDVRKAAYWAVFAGAHGHTYGCNDIWQMYAPPRQGAIHARTPWYEALALPGADQMQHLKALILSRPFLSRVPDQGLLAGGGHGLHVAATRDADGSYAMIYMPEASHAITVEAGRLCDGPLNAWWYDPRTGEAIAIDGEFRGGAALTFTAPAEGPDWVLVLDDASRGFPAPGN